MTDNGDDTFTAMLTPFDVETEVYYYLEAEASDGKTITRPLPGAEGAWVFTVKDCTVGIEQLENFDTKLETIFQIQQEQSPVFPLRMILLLRVKLK